MLKMQLGVDVSSSLRRICQGQGCTLFMGLVAAMSGLFYRYTGQTDLILGSPVAGRDHVDLEDQIGLYANTLALRICFEHRDSFQQLLGRVKEKLLGAYGHQQYPFDELVEELQLRRDRSRNPLFGIQVIVQETDG